MVIEFDLTNWHHLGVRLTAEGNRLHLHRSPLDGPNDEVILECPHEYAASAATGEARSGAFRVFLPIDPKQLRKKQQEKWLQNQFRRALVLSEQSPDLLNCSVENCSRN